jgi:hypothetical protein
MNENEFHDNLIAKYQKDIVKKKEELKILEAKTKDLKMKQNKETILAERRIIAKQFSSLLSATNDKQKKRLEDLKNVLNTFDKVFNIQANDLTEFDLQF